MSVARTSLDYICLISEKYLLPPMKTVSIYDRVMEKRYITNSQDGLLLTARYINRYHKQLKEQDREWWNNEKF